MTHDEPKYVILKVIRIGRRNLEGRSGHPGQPRSQGFFLARHLKSERKRDFVLLSPIFFREKNAGTRLFIS